jgi:hypothetical protein
MNVSAMNNDPGAIITFTGEAFELRIRKIKKPWLMTTGFFWWQ